VAVRLLVSLAILRFYPIRPGRAGFTPPTPCLAIAAQGIILPSMRRALILVASCVVIAVLAVKLGRRPTPAPRLHIQPAQILADGYDTATLRIESRARPQIAILDHTHAVTIGPVSGAGPNYEAQIRAGIQPGRIRLRVIALHVPAAEVALDVLPFHRDSAEDGTPDFLRLQDDRDQLAFRRWFTWLAEAQYFQPAPARPPEINDCAALIRYAYREALHTHDETWAALSHLPFSPAGGSVAKYQYPFTPLGAALFRVQAGAFEAADLTNGSFAQFADAKTLQRLNTHLVTRLLSAALPGDLLFFHQATGAERFHSMIYLGESQIQNDGKRYILYHTGPAGTGPGEMRRLTVDELVRFPQSEWRPLVTNSCFLGVFRWNILRKESDTLE
jgi:uncharacterized protein